GSEVFGIKFAVFVQHFCMKYFDHVTGIAAHVEAYPADQVLSKVGYQGTFGRLPDPDWLYLLYLAHGHGLCSHQVFLAGVGHGHSRPRAIVKASCIPAWHLLACIVSLAIVNAVHEDRTIFGSLPAAVRDDGLFPAVGIGDLQLA